MSDWHENDNEYRLISSYNKPVDGTKILVSAAASQEADGSLKNEPSVDVPLVYIDELDDRGDSYERLTITPQAARKLAEVLLDAAAEIDGWTRGAVRIEASTDV